MRGELFSTDDVIIGLTNAVITSCSYKLLHCLSIALLIQLKICYSTFVVISNAHWELRCLCILLFCHPAVIIFRIRNDLLIPEGELGQLQLLSSQKKS